MSIENRVLSNIDYTTHNYSNYRITTEETRDIVDVPFFPAQNLVEVNPVINLYRPAASGNITLYVPFIDKDNTERLFALLSRPDARFTFIEFADNARYFHYRFGGNSFPQGRDEGSGGESYTYNGKQLFLFGGYCDGRCTDDLWMYEIDTNTWININYHTEEKPVNEAPSKRRKASILYFKSSDAEQIWLFGGETDLLSINSEQEEFFVTLNDLWVFDLQKRTWTNFDKNRVLPHRPGHIVYVDMMKVRIYIKGGYNDIGVYEPPAIWTVDIATDTVSSTPYAGPFQPSHKNVSFTINGTVHILVGNHLYKWNETEQQLELVKSDVVAVNPVTKKYWTVVDEEVNFGDQPTMTSTKITVAELYEWNDTKISEKRINLPPRGSFIPRVNIDNQATFWFGGLIDPDHFNESTYIMDHTTRWVTKYDYPEDQRPTERVFHALTYDRFRGRIWLFGGFDGSKFYNDLWYFDLSEKKWYMEHGQLENTDDQNPTYPQPRQKAGIAVVAGGRFLYVIGGYSDTHAFNDFWVYDIERKEWTEVFTTDTIPWGSVYFLFEWRDRLWMYNGRELYRFFYKMKQFVAQELYIPEGEESDPVADLIRQKRYLDTPIQLTLVNDRLFIRNPKYHFYIDMETREVRNIQKVFKISDDVVWMDKYYGVAIHQDKLIDYYINVSPLYPLSRNQIPHSVDSGPVNSTARDALVFRDPLEAEGHNKFRWNDHAGQYAISAKVEEIDKAEALMNSEVTVAGTQDDYPNLNFHSQEAVIQATIEKLAQPYVALYRPLFKYAKYKPISYKYAGARKVLYNPRTQRAYVVYNSGNVVRFNPIDGTFFVYYTKLWRGAAIGYYSAGNKIYCFGGVYTGSKKERTPYTQHGFPCTIATTNRIDDPVSKYKDETDQQFVEFSHCGLLEFDLNMDELNLGTIENYIREKRVRVVDYNITRDYLYNIVKHYIEGYANNTIPESIEEVKEKVYQALQPIVDDLSQFDFVYEQGERPFARAYPAYCQIEDKLYIFGGAQCYNETQKAGCAEEGSPIFVCINEPYYCTWVGAIENTPPEGQEGGPPTMNTIEESKKCYVFDMSKKLWREIAPLPEWRYLASAIPSPDGKKIFVVGGYTAPKCGGVTNSILVYDIEKDSWDKIRGIPDSFTPRANPILFWHDEYHLIIAYGIQSFLVQCSGEGSGEGSGGGSGEGCKYEAWAHIPVGDAWIYDIRHKIFYKAWEDLSTPGSMVIKDQYGYEDEEEIWIVPLSEVKLSITSEDKFKLKLRKWNLTNGVVQIEPVTLAPELMDIWNTASMTPAEMGQQIASSASVEVYTDINSYTPVYIDEKVTSSLAVQNNTIRFRYGWIQPFGPYEHKHLFLVAEIYEKAGIEWIEEVARGQKEAQLRLYYIDLDLPAASRRMHQIPYGYPLPISPVLVSYDGDKYLYVIYNKYNIWRLDLKAVFDDPYGSHWTMLPPCINCNFLGDSRTSPTWTAYYIEPQYMAIVNEDGALARMDTKTFVWFLDKRLAPVMPVDDINLVIATGLDHGELYMYRHGGISGKVMNIYERQWDNFFFDMSIVADVDKMFRSIVDKSLWPTVVKRRRLYTINHQGHIFYAWLRIDGVFDVEYQLEDFYRVDEVRVYGDYNMLDQADNTTVSVFHIAKGWVELPKDQYTVEINEIGWDWDAQYDRQYVRQIMSPYNIPVYQYTKCPPNYLKVDLRQFFGGEDVPISKIRVRFKNTPKPYNYLSRINKVEAITTQTDMAAYDNPTAANPVEIIHIEPMTPDETFSQTFAVTVKNTASDPVHNVVAYVYNNKWLQFTLTPDDDESWTIRDQNYPFTLRDILNPGEVVTFFIRAVNRDYRPHKTDLVIRGIYSYKK